MSFLMSKLRSKIDLWRSWEDEVTARWMNDRYRAFHRIGFIALNLNPKWIYLSLVVFTVCALTQTFVSTCLMISCFKMSANFEDSSGPCNVGVLSTLAGLFLIHNTNKRRAVMNSHRKLASPFHDYNEPQYSQSSVDSFKRTLFRLNLALIALAVYVAFINILVVFICPFIDERLGFARTEPYDEFGANHQLPIPMWIPFATHEGFFHWFAYLGMEGFGGTLICLNMGGSILMFTVQCGGMLMEMKLLELSIANIEKRAKQAYTHDKGLKPASGSSLYEDPYFQECIGRCLRENVVHHQKILEYFKIMMKVSERPLVVAFIAETLAIAMSMIALNQGSAKWGANIAFCSIAIGEIIIMVIMCMLGEHITFASYAINERIYFSKWYKYNINNRKTVLMFLIETQRPLTPTAYSIIICNMEQFTAVMNTAYSFFNLLKVSKARE